jgi:hypothetical protein
MSEDCSHLACPNPDCSASGQREQGNLRPHDCQPPPSAFAACAVPPAAGTSPSANTPLFGLRGNKRLGEKQA